MARARSQRKTAGTTIRLTVRLDDQSKTYLTQAAELRHMSVSEYVRTVAVAQARREVLAARDQVIALTPDEQLAFWKALNELAEPTGAQQRLGAMMRGQS